MTRPREYDAVFEISHAIFQLADDNVVPEIGDDVRRSRPPSDNRGATVLCVIADGPVRVRAQAWDTAPSPETAHAPIEDHLRQVWPDT